MQVKCGTDSIELCGIPECNHLLFMHILLLDKVSVAVCLYIFLKYDVSFLF